MSVGFCLASFSGIKGLTCTGLQWQGFAREAILSLASSNSVILSALGIAENYIFKYKKKTIPKQLAAREGGSGGGRAGSDKPVPCNLPVRLGK